MSVAPPAVGAIATPCDDSLGAVSHKAAPTPTATTPAPILIAKCDVQGCVEGSTTSYCHADGTHFCER